MDYRRYRLDQLLEIKYGKDKKLVESIDGKYPIFGTGGLMGYANDFLYDKPSILIGRKGTISKVKYVDEPFWTVDTLFWTKINDAIVDPKFLYYKLSCIDFNNYNEGTTIPSLRTETLNRIELEIPDLETQKKIVRILSALDQKIESNSLFLKQLSQISAVIFKNMYDNMSSSKELSLGEICNIKYGKNLPTKYLSEEGFPVYGANGIIGYHSEKMYSRPQVLVSCRGVAGAVHISEPNSFVTNNSLILECEDKFHYFIKEYSLSRKYDDYATGSAQPQITINNIKENTLKIPINDEELYAFNKICAPLEAQYFQTVKQIKTLGTLRDALLPKLMSGEINLEKVEI